jgi:hypothetical protein
LLRRRRQIQARVPPWISMMATAKVAGKAGAALGTKRVRLPVTPAKPCAHCRCC